ncbi:alpha-L-fucosidase [Rhizoctonia solani AG-3 Rhs1AP]|uniref:alpha-L-fucosidase n=1 Tax=Rhizoctonia solani AG-3 Rhs1AP TaxID=1086054 RepID=X8JLC8_9AGAM|nr:alpha-L-fucosidase [Rhizoctonia solani AG-3 Rhs1AP]
MRSKLFAYLCLLFALLQCCSAKSVSTFVDLSPHFNNKAASARVNGTGNFDLAGGSYVAKFLPKGVFSYRGVDFNLPPFHNETALDNVRVAAQVVSVPPGRYHAVHALLAAEKNNIGQGNITVNYTDGTSITIGVVAPAYFQTNNPSNGPIWTPYHYANTTILTPEGINYNETWIFTFQAGLDNSKIVQSIQLPTAKTPVMHFFAITLYGTPPAQTPNTPVLNVQYARSTTKWAQSNYSANAVPDPATQIFEVALDNLAPMDASTSTWLNGNYSVVIEGQGLKTYRPYSLRRLRSGDQVVMKIGVRNSFKVPTKTKGRVIVKDTHGKAAFKSEEYDFTAGIPDYKPADASLSQHEASDWFDEAKFGIFIHWGVYSVPAWSDGKTYAESYTWIQHKINSSTWTRHREVYDENVVYDDFIANFTASEWSPDEWTDLFANSGAKYFTIVSKHHDGFALYDTKNTSNRNSLKYGPKRDLLKDLFASSKTRHPELHRTAYYSMTEFFHPQFPYGFGSWPGGLAHFAYNDTCCEGYEGYVKINDWVQDLQKPQMETLLYDYEVDAIWCDIGGPSPFDEIAAGWYNWAKKNGRQVNNNNRCGGNYSDFNTPEYFTLNSYQVRKWESNSGLDPHSYGYNSGTALDKYMKGVDVVKQLVDIVSKGGNYLLDVGPTATGQIIPEMTTPLLQAGKWLSYSGEAIYSTHFWPVGPADTTYNLRFTTTPEAFYLIALSRPESGVVRTEMPIPILEGDEVRLLGGSGKVLEWAREDKEVVIRIGEEEVGLVEYAWVFKILYKS